MEKVVVIGANAFQLPLILKAKQMGCETHVFAWEQGAVAKEAADFFYPVSITDVDEILKICREIQPAAVTSIGSDLAVVAVNALAEALGLAGNPTKTTLCCTNKYVMRCTLAKEGLPVPGFFRWAPGEDFARAETLGFPLIVKPTDRSGSRGVALVTAPEQLEAAAQAAAAVSFEGKAIIESFFDGREYSCESISQNGKHHFLAITQKFTTGAPHFIETGHIQPADLDADAQERIFAVLDRCLTALGVENGAGHSEFRINAQGEMCIMEIGARMGGDCIGSHLVQLSTGHDFLLYVLDTALGRPITLRQAQPRAAAVRFIFGAEDLAVLEHIRRTAPECLIYESPVEESMAPIQDSSTRHGYFVIQCDTRRQAMELCGFAEGKG